MSNIENLIISLQTTIRTGLSENRVAGVALLDVPERLRLKSFIALAPKITDEQFWSYLGQFWRAEYKPGYWQDEEWRFLFRSKRPGREACMGADNYKTLLSLPEKVRVYRGASFEGRNGLCWSLDWKVARAYQAMRPGEMHMWTAVIHKSAIAAYFARFGESEVLVPDPTGVELFQRGTGNLPGLTPAMHYTPGLDWITETIALGDHLDSQNLPPEFDSVLNVAVDAPVMHEKPCLHLPLIDYEEIPFELLDRARHFLSEADRQRHKVFVHCRAGLSRGPSIVAMWLAIKDGTDFQTALGQIQKHRAARPAPKVAQSIEKYLEWRAARPVTDFRIDR